MANEIKLTRLQEAILFKMQQLQDNFKHLSSLYEEAKSENEQETADTFSNVWPVELGSLDEMRRKLFHAYTDFENICILNAQDRKKEA